MPAIIPSTPNNPNTLQDNSACYCKCIPPGMMMAVLIFLLDQWLKKKVEPVVPFFFANDGALRSWVDVNGTHSVSNYTLAQFQAQADYASVTTLTFTTATNLTAISGLQELPALVSLGVGRTRCLTVDCSGLIHLNNVNLSTNFTPHSECTSLIVTGCSALVGLVADKQSLTSVDISTCILLTGVHFQQNFLTQAAVDAILHQLVLHGQTGGNCVLDGAGNAAPSVAGLADKATLQGLIPPWTVTTN